MATVGGCAGFAAVSGSSVATTATMGMVALPEMRRYHYDRQLATGCIAAGGSIGILIPPSIILVIYGILTEQSIGKLFLAGFIPGVLEAVFYMITIYILCSINPHLGPRGEKSRFKERLTSLKDTWGVLVLFLLVIGGIYLGVFTPTEAAGVGAFGDGMINLKSLHLIEILNRKVIKEKTPFLGICLGMQLLASEGHEFGINPGLGWIKSKAVKLKSNNLRLPHVGWNEIRLVKNGALMKDLPDRNFYFVHSYYLKISEPKIITSYCRYGEKFASSIQKENIFATQFHPEKSQMAGLKIIENFLHAKNIIKN